MKILSPFVYIYHGILAIFEAIFSFIKHVFLGIAAFPMMIARIFTGKSTSKVTIESRKTNNSYKKTDILLAEHEREKAKREAEEERIRNRKQALSERNAQKRLSDYIADSAKLEEKTENEKLDKYGNKKLSFGEKIRNLFDTQLGAGGQIKDKYQDAEEMVINYDGPEAVKSKEKQTYEYIARNQEGAVVKGYFTARSIVEVHSYLRTQGCKVYSIRTSKLINLLYGNVGGTHDKFKTKDLIFFLAQVSTYLKVGIPLAEAIDLIVQLRRTPLRHISTIAQVTGFSDGIFHIKHVFNNK